MTLDDFFNPSSAWEEDRYNVADLRDVTGIAAEVAGCGDYQVQEIELRLGNNFSQLKFDAGQANDSARSDQSLTVEVLANNSQAEIRSIPFNEIQSFDIPVDGVNAVRIRLSLDYRVPECRPSVHGVLMESVLE